MSLKRFLLGPRRAARHAADPPPDPPLREAACDHPERVQTELLLRILATPARHRLRPRPRLFAHRRRHRLPPATARRALRAPGAPYIERVQNGETNALLADRRVHLFALTSGTTASRKLIPVTDAYLAAYRRGWNMWGMKNYRDHKDRRISMRPIVQLGGDPEEFRTPGRHPVREPLWVHRDGAEADDPRAVRGAVPWPGRSRTRRPGTTSPCGSPSAATCRSSWPRTRARSSALARTLDAEKEHLLRDLRDGTLREDLDIPSDIRAMSLAAKLKPNPARAARTAPMSRTSSGRLYPMDVWPTDGTIINTWTGGSMGPYLRQLAGVLRRRRRSATSACSRAKAA